MTQKITCNFNSIALDVYFQKSDYTENRISEIYKKYRNHPWKFMGKVQLLDIDYVQAENERYLPR